MSELKSQVAEWYNDKSVFITGGTGFMGKVLLEKLLYSCLGIKYIYLLLRNKKGKTPHQRVEDMWQLPIKYPNTMSNAKSPIAEWYSDKSVFITGASGFMGKVLVEKLLYSCSGVKCIYILLRPKRGKSPEKRVQDMWNLPLFDRLRNSQPNAFMKIVPINGDLTLDGLNLTTKGEDLLINDVSVVFHLGATLKLEANLKDALEQNTRGTASVLDLSKRMKNLKAFVHFSTAFCTADIDVLEERVYGTAEKPRDVITVVKSLDPKILDVVTPKVIAPHPNTYSYSKRLAETLIAEEKDNIPIAIIRPAIVLPAVDEPLPGWVDSLNGPIGLVVGAGKGVIRSMHCKGENRGQFIPVDFAVNASIIVAKLIATAKSKQNEVQVYNLTQDALLRVTYKELLDKARAIGNDYPFEMQIWYPDGDFRSSKMIHNVYSIFFHWLPAILIDLVMFISGQKTFMIRIQKKIHNGLELLQFFTNREWTFKSEKFLALNNYMTEEDRKIFSISDFYKYSLEEYMINSVLGARQYCVKEDLSSLPRCRQKQKVLYVIHKACVFGFYILILYYFFRVCISRLY